MRIYLALDKKIQSMTEKKRIREYHSLLNKN